MKDTTRECIDSMLINTWDNDLEDADSRLKYALAYLTGDEDIKELYELIKTGKAPGAGKQTGAEK